MQAHFSVFNLWLGQGIGKMLTRHPKNAKFVGTITHELCSNLMRLFNQPLGLQMGSQSEGGMLAT